MVILAGEHDFWVSASLANAMPSNESASHRYTYFAGTP
ncbi:hypothetical protein PAMC26577_05465 [Caballeronia sordidicola]|uniref:Uncharacterized protein n=1 Tax=Caballeronia sordidicola TaxID=196367 RepID=A0A242N327_CABSO|nr:hypothetical protein PAMC26577_05465 [Caballeronia sordidicola]